MSLRHLFIAGALWSGLIGCSGDGSGTPVKPDLRSVGNDDDLATPPGSDLAGATDLAKASTDQAGTTNGPPYTVTTSDASINGATLTVYTPKVPAGQKAPLVLWKHGYLLDTSDYDGLCRAIAAAGFVVIGVDTGGSLLSNPTNLEERDATITALDWALDSSSPVAGLVAGQPIAVGGHSRGGKVATMVAAADSRIDAALLYDPVNGCGPGQDYSTDCPDITAAAIAGALAIPVGVAGETNNATGGFQPCAPTDQNYTTVYDALAKATWAVQWTFTGADHMDFTDTGGGGVGSLCPDGPGNDTTIRSEMHALAVAFFRRHLAGDNTMDAQLTGASVPSDIKVVGP